MGFFDPFKGEETAGRPSGAGARPAARFGLADIVKAYGLKEKEPYEQSYEGASWWEGETGATRFAVMESGTRLMVHIGTIAEITEIYLGRVSTQTPLPPEGSPARIDGIVQGHPVSQQFFLQAYPRGAFDHPQLRLPGVLDALARLSPAVSEVMIYETYQGVTLVLGGQFARADLDRDLAAGVDMVKAIAGR